MAPEDPNRKERSPWLQLGVVMSVVFTIPAAVAVGALAGSWLDEKAGTSPWITLLLVAAGFAAGLREVFRQLRRVNDA